MGALLKLALRALLARWALAHLGWKIVSSLLVFFPVAWLLKVIGIPLLIVLAIVALPILMLLIGLGLPVLMVLLVGAAMLSVLGGLLSVGMLALKIAIPIAVVIWVARWLFPDDLSDPDAA